MHVEDFELTITLKNKMWNSVVCLKITVATVWRLDWMGARVEAGDQSEGFPSIPLGGPIWKGLAMSW